MKAFEIFQQITPDFADSILRFFRESEREIYKTTLSSLAIQKKLRPVFVQKKPAREQIAWLVKMLKLRTSDAVGEHLLQVWLLKSQSPMLIKFLDDMGIEHDGEGAVEDLPKTIDAGKLKAAVDGLLAEHPPEKVTLYLHVFQQQESEGWPELESLLAEDERLTLHPREEPSPAEA